MYTIFSPTDPAVADEGHNIVALCHVENASPRCGMKQQKEKH